MMLPRSSPSLSLIITLALALGAACSRPSTTPVVLEVEGRSNATPWIAAQGRFVAVAWGASLAGKADVFVAVSRDGGTTFGPAVQVNRAPGEARLGGEFPPRVTVVSTPERSIPEIAVLWTAHGTPTQIKTARSRDAGRTFDAPVSLQSSSAVGDRGWPALAADPDGRMHAIWLDHRGLAGSTPRSSHSAHSASAIHDGVAMAQKSAVYYASPTSAGSVERELAKGVCYCCKTALAIGPDRTIYAAWRHVYPGNLRDMAFALSRDDGASFTAPVRVSEDGWSINGCPDDGPAMAVDASGTIHLVWPTVIGGAHPEGALFYAATRDGRTFTPRVRVQTLGGRKPSHPQVVVNSDGRVVVAWDENLTGRTRAVVREIRPLPGGSANFGDIVELAPGATGVYPVLAATDRGFTAVWATAGSGSRVFVRAVPLPPSP